MKFSTSLLRLLALMAALASFAWTSLGEEQADPAPAQTEQTEPAPAAPSDSDTAPAPAKPEKPAKKKKPSRSHSRGGAEAPFGNVTIGENDKVAEAVSVFGNLVVRGSVDREATSVFGNNWILEKADVGQDAVAVFGGLHIDGKVHGDAVAVFGNIYLGPKGEIEGERKAVFGRVVHTDGTVEPSDRHSFSFDQVLEQDNPLGAYVHECLLKGRLLWFGPHLGWIWGVALIHLFFYALLALVLRKPTERCVRTFEERPAMSIFTAFLCFLLVPIVFILLVITGIGAIVVPVLVLAMFALSIFGRTVMHAWLGRSITRFLGDGPLSHVAVSVLFGGVLLSILYCVPVVAFIVHPVIGSVGFGAVVYTIALSMQKEKKTPVPPYTPDSFPPPPAVPVPPAPVSPSFAAPLSAPPSPSTAVPPPVSPVGFAAVEPETPKFVAPEPQPAAYAAPVIPPVQPAAASAPTVPLAAKLPGSSLPRASFWVRMGALAIDTVVASLLIGGWNSVTPRFISISYMPGVIFLMALYGALIWKYKSTSIGGIVFKLQVVRTDDKPLDWSTCIVRALGCILSIFAAGIGFLWILIDPNRDAWHDKIAGTAVVQSPDNQRLV